MSSRSYGMEKTPRVKNAESLQSRKKAMGSQCHGSLAFSVLALAALVWLYVVQTGISPTRDSTVDLDLGVRFLSYGPFPKADSHFRWQPCTAATVPPPLDDAYHQRTWSDRFDPNPKHWRWGPKVTDEADVLPPDDDPYAGRGIYLCGYFDVPLDYTNVSDKRIARLAVTKYQVSGLARGDESLDAGSPAGRKSERTLVVEPGGPGGSGCRYVWEQAEELTQRFSSGKFDVLGWDPRGVGSSLPGLSCFPFYDDRDRWAMLTGQHRFAVTLSPRAQLGLVDAMNNATFAACKKFVGDFPRFVSTAFVARDLERIRIALGEQELTGYVRSYGTAIGQTYANMFPNSVGRLILDGPLYVPDQRSVVYSESSIVDNATFAWNHGLLSECIDAGPDYCALAKPLDGDSGPVTLADLKSRISALLSSLVVQPLPAFTAEVGPSLVTYSSFVNDIFTSLYNARSWPSMTQAIYDLEQGNTTLAAVLLNTDLLARRPSETYPPLRWMERIPNELPTMVTCSDCYDAPQLSHRGPNPKATDDDDLEWWDTLWHNVTNENWLGGDGWFFGVLPCRHYNRYFGPAAEVYRGGLNNTLAHPVLVIAPTYDPITPLQNGKRLLADMGKNARLIVHHGYGHLSTDKSTCTDVIARQFILHGVLPEALETDCFADGKPYRYSVD